MTDRDLLTLDTLWGFTVGAVVMLGLLGLAGVSDLADAWRERG